MIDLDDSRNVNIARLLDKRRSGLLPVRHKNSDRAIILIHGFRSNAISTWGLEDGAFWPFELGRRHHADVYCYQHDNRSFRGGSTTPLFYRDISRTLAHQLAYLPYRRFVLVAHSFGGIVAKGVLTFSVDADPLLALFSRKVFGLSALGCPNYGHWFAVMNTAFLAGGLLSAPNARLLLPRSKKLIALHDQFRLAQARLPNLGIQSVAENGYVAGVFRVDRGNAHAMGGECHVSSKNHRALAHSLDANGDEFRWIDSFCARRFAAADCMELPS